MGGAYMIVPWMNFVGTAEGGFPPAVIIMTIAAIYLLGRRLESGWYAAIIGGLVALVVSGVTHYVRHATLDYLYGSLMGLSIVIMLLIPVFKARLLTVYSEKPATETEENLQPKPT